MTLGNTFRLVMITMFSTSSIALLWLGVSLILFHQIIVASCLSGQDVSSQAPVCRPFNQSSGMSELCGYKDTAEYFWGLDELDVAKWLSQDDYFKLINSSCSKTLRLLECGNSFPRCVSNVRGPFLPCKRVGLEFFSRCGEALRNRSEWLYWTTRWASNNLPERDDPSTMDYRKRCFEPPSFKGCDSKCDLEPLKCFPLVVPECQNFGYKFTIYPEKYQKEYMEDGLAFRTKPNDTFCSVLERKLDCTATFPPCFKEEMIFGGSCREDCLSFFRNNCSSSSFYKNKEKCSSFPKRLSANDVVCKQTEWLNDWPGISMKRKNEQCQQKGNLTLILILLASTTLMGWFFGK